MVRVIGVKGVNGLSWMNGKSWVKGVRGRNGGNGKNGGNGRNEVTPPPLAGGGWGEGATPMRHDPLPPAPSRKGRGSILLDRSRRYCPTLHTASCAATSNGYIV